MAQMEKNMENVVCELGYFAVSNNCGVSGWGSAKLY